MLLPVPSWKHCLRIWSNQVPLHTGCAHTSAKWSGPAAANALSACDAVTACRAHRTTGHSLIVSCQRAELLKVWQTRACHGRLTLVTALLPAGSRRSLISLGHDLTAVWSCCRSSAARAGAMPEVRRSRPAATPDGSGGVATAPASAAAARRSSGTGDFNSGHMACARKCTCCAWEAPQQQMQGSAAERDAGTS